MTASPPRYSARNGALSLTHGLLSIHGAGSGSIPCWSPTGYLCPDAGQWENSEKRQAQAKFLPYRRGYMCSYTQAYRLGWLFALLKQYLCIQVVWHPDVALWITWETLARTGLLQMLGI